MALDDVLALKVRFEGDGASLPHTVCKLGVAGGTGLWEKLSRNIGRRILTKGCFLHGRQSLLEELPTRSALTTPSALCVPPAPRSWAGSASRPLRISSTVWIATSPLSPRNAAAARTPSQVSQ